VYAWYQRARPPSQGLRKLTRSVESEEDVHRYGTPNEGGRRERKLEVRPGLEHRSDVSILAARGKLGLVFEAKQSSK